MAGDDCLISTLDLSSIPIVRIICSLYGIIFVYTVRVIDLIVHHVLNHLVDVGYPP